MCACVLIYRLVAIVERRKRRKTAKEEATADSHNEEKAIQLGKEVPTLV